MSTTVAIKKQDTEEIVRNKADKVQNAKRAFFLSLFDLSWRLLAGMLVPIFIGLFIDSKIGHGQTFAVIGFFVGIIAGVVVVRSVVHKISEGNKF